MNLLRRIKRGAILSLLVPFLSLAVSAWAVYKYYDDLGPVIHVEFPSAEGIEEGKTPLKYHGIPVGTVIKLEVSKDLRKVDFVIRLVKNASHVANSGAKFWIVRPKAGLSGLENLETIVSGNYIAVDLPKRIGKNSGGFNQCHFTGHEKNIQSFDTSESDFIVKVKVPHVFSSTMVGSFVLYKGYAVGIIDEMNLPQNGKNILLTLNIKEEYAHLLRSNTIFWNPKTIDLEWHLFRGFMMKATPNPIKSILFGGISFSTPPILGKKVNRGHIYNLTPGFSEEWLHWEPNIE